ncbi:MAG TPA: cyclic nucleotide-binding domain-containing protein [Acidimicrobiia bacterium]|jgi:CRP-like cAMP-binding protein
MGAVMRHRSQRERYALEQLRTSIPVPPGKVLTRQGCPCREFAIVVEGTVQVTRDGREIALLEAGESFGEIGIVRGIASPVTIVASSAVTLEVMNLGEFRSAYATMPAFRVSVDHQIDRRIATWLEPSAAPDLAPDADFTLAS